MKLFARKQPKPNTGPAEGTWQISKYSNGDAEVRRWQFLPDYDDWLWAELSFFDTEEEAVAFVDERKAFKHKKIVGKYEIAP